MSSGTTKQKGGLGAVLPVLVYCSASIMMTMVNKYCMSQFKFHVAFLMLAVQSTTCVLFMWLFGMLGVINYRTINLSDARKWVRVSLMMSAMLYTGGKSLQYLTVPLFTIFKNLTIIIVAYGERVMFQSEVTTLMLVSFLLMAMSSVIGGWNDITFSVAGYFWMASNCISSALYALFMRGVIKSMEFKDFDTVYYNNVMTAPIFLVLSALTEDWPEFANYYFHDKANESEFNALVRALLLVAYASSWCIRKTNSTTYSMAGALNKLPIAVFAMFYFDDVVTIGGIAAVILGFLAGLVYTKAKINQQEKKEKADYIPLHSKD
ncbi:GDP-mannose transporter [Syncephalis fuscata]|nr:GDP-mannose transporter [Syncephalis fuscata]